MAMDIFTSSAEKNPILQIDSYSFPQKCLFESFLNSILNQHRQLFKVFKKMQFLPRFYSLMTQIVLWVKSFPAHLLQTCFCTIVSSTYKHLQGQLSFFHHKIKANSTPLCSICVVTMVVTWISHLG